MEPRAIFLFLALAVAAYGEADVTCHQDWYLSSYGGTYNCYFVGEGGFTQPGAKDQCASLQSTLVETETSDEIEYVGSLLEDLKGDANSLGVPGSWLNADNNDGVWSWENSEFTDTNWYDESSLPTESGYCAYMAGDAYWQWKTLECSPDSLETMLYVCEDEAVIGASFGTSYLLSHYTLRDETENLCEVDNSFLARIDSADENDFVKQFLRDAAENAGDWFGSSRNYNFGDPIYIAGKDEDGDGRYLYDSGDILNFYDWANGGPSGDGACIGLDPNNGYQWVSLECDLPRHYLCEWDESIFIG